MDPLGAEITRLSQEIAGRARNIGLTKKEIARRAGLHRHTIDRFFANDGRGCWRLTIGKIEQVVATAESEILERLQSGGRAA